MRAARRPTPAEVVVIETVRDAQVAVTLCTLADELGEDAESAQALIGGEGLAARLRARRQTVLALLGKEQAA